MSSDKKMKEKNEQQIETKPSKGLIRSFVGSIVKPSQWMGYSGAKGTAYSLMDMAKRLFRESDVNNAPKTVEEVAAELGLTSEALLKKERVFLRLAIWLLGLMVLVLGYAAYQFFEGFYRAMFPTIVLSMVCLAQAFRYHFWYVQLKIGKLGCTFNDWFNYVFSGKNHE